MSKKLLGLLCILGCAVAPFGAFAAGDETERFYDDNLLCEAFDGWDSIHNEYTSWDGSCHRDSSVCEEWRNLSDSDKEGWSDGFCDGAPVEIWASTDITYTGDQQQGVTSCQISFALPFYRCAAGYYGTADSCDSHTCKRVPGGGISNGGLVATTTYNEDGSSTWTCNSGYTKYTNQQIRNNSNQLVTFTGCCATSWTNSTSDSTGGKVYKHRACWPQGTTVITQPSSSSDKAPDVIGIAACRGSYSYPTSFNPKNVYCASYNKDTLKPTALCSGCDNECAYGTSYPPVNATMVRKQTVAKSTSTNTIYGSYTSACTTTYGDYMCAVGYHANGKTLTASSTCEECPKTSDFGLTTVHASSTNDYWTTGTSAMGAQNKTDCYANSGYTDIDDTVTYNDGTGTFYWESDDANYYNCHYTN